MISCETQLAVDGFEGGRVPKVKKYGGPKEAGKDKQSDSLP